MSMDSVAPFLDKKIRKSPQLRGLLDVAGLAWMLK
jgi:hypothetical protein